MKKVLLVVVIAALFIACNNEKTADIDSRVLDSGSIPRSTTVDSINAWVERLSSTYDARPALKAFLARGEHFNLDIIKTWSDSLKGKIDADACSSKELFLFLPRFDPVWKSDSLQRDASNRILSRIRIIPSQQIDQWRKLLKEAQEDGISDLWVVGLTATIDQLFSSSGYEENIASVMQKRFEVIPPRAADSLAKLLNTAKADAAVHIISGDFLFDNNGFRQEVFDKAVAELRKGIKKSDLD